MAENRYFKGQTKIPTKEMPIKQARYRYRIIDNSKGEVLDDGLGGADDLENLFPREIHGFLKKEIDRDRLVDTTLRLANFTYEIKKSD
jgi:hypothetical protein